MRLSDYNFTFLENHYNATLFAKVQTVFLAHCYAVARVFWEVARWLLRCSRLLLGGCEVISHFSSSSPMICSFDLHVLTINKSMAASKLPYFLVQVQYLF